MRRLAASILILTACLTRGLATDTPQRPLFDQSNVVEALGKIDVAGSRLYLYSLDPANRQPVIHDAPNVFHGFPILGKVEIKPQAERKRLFETFIKGVAESTGMEADCFEPRHGIRLVRNGRITDFVICYSCLSVDTYGFGSFGVFLTGGSPLSTFNGFLDEYHLKKAPADN